MTADDHVQLLGKLLGNLQSLELAIRALLSARPGARQVQEAHAVDISDLPVGSVLPVSDFTDRTYFSELVTAFNVDAASRSKPQINVKVVSIRNALAHGSVFTRAKAFPLRLLRFSKPTNGRVTMRMNEEMSEEWFGEHIKVVFDAIQIVTSSQRP